MQRIVASITTLEHHLEALELNSEVYRPDACPHCRLGGLWRHGCYHRKADRSAGGESRNPVAVLRFLCRECLRTCSRLPACIAPRRWYDWAVQQLVLMMMLLGGGSVHGCSRLAGCARRTVRRWRDWLDARSERFAFFLRSRFAELGRLADHESFWRYVLDSLSLAQAMAWVDRDLTVP